MRIHAHCWQFSTPSRKRAFEIYVCQAGCIFGFHRHAYLALWDNKWHSGLGVKLFRVLFMVEKISLLKL